MADSKTDTWFLVGVAARMATGMGLHTSEVYQSLAVDAAEHQKRIFFSLYMMDRYVSIGYIHIKSPKKEVLELIVPVLFPSLWEDLMLFRMMISQWRSVDSFLFQLQNSY